MITMKNYTRRELSRMTKFGKYHGNWLTHTRVITSGRNDHIQPCAGFNFSKSNSNFILFNTNYVVDMCTCTENDQELVYCSMMLV